MAFMKYAENASLREKSTQRITVGLSIRMKMTHEIILIL